MKIAVFWRENRNIEFQKKIEDQKNLYDDAYHEALQHAQGLMDADFDVVLLQWNMDPEDLLNRLVTEKIDLVFNVSSLEEAYFLEQNHIPYVGTKVKTLKLDKAQRKEIVSSHGVNTSVYQIIDSVQDLTEITIPYPLFVKPLNGRGSAGIDDSNIVEKEGDLRPVVKKITETIGQAALVERYIVGREMTVGFIQTKNPLILPVLEIEYSYGKTNGFSHKMNDHERLHCPAQIDDLTQRRIVEMVQTVISSLEIKDFGRIDFILDEQNMPIFLEVNTFAGLTFPDQEEAHIGYMGTMAKTMGLSQKLFLKKIVESCLEAYVFN